jgi:hypothetical protein
MFFECGDFLHIVALVQSAGLGEHALRCITEEPPLPLAVFLFVIRDAVAIILL